MRLCPTTPQRVCIVGAGMVGLSTAWFLQERGVEVTVLDRKGIAAGASWGNAGWITPESALHCPSRRCCGTGFVRCSAHPRRCTYRRH